MPLDATAFNPFTFTTVDLLTFPVSGFGFGFSSHGYGEGPAQPRPYQGEEFSLRALSNLLRHPDQWPRNFPDWDYQRGRSCALGLGYAAWGVYPQTYMREEDSTRIFAKLSGPGGMQAGVTPNQVADALDKHLGIEKPKARPLPQKARELLTA